MAPSHSVKVLEHCRISPPPSTTSETSLPLTFFDLLWITCPSVEHLMFYHLPHSTTINHFTLNILPLLKHSLSLALQCFFPLAGTLNWPQDPNTKPTLNYTVGDSVSLTVAESHSNFNHLVSDHARESHIFHPLVPKLVPSSDTTIPVLALQVTVFPNSGICIGFVAHHGIADGNTALQFMRSWSKYCRLVGNELIIHMTESPPSFDRSIIKDPDGLGNIYSKDLRHHSFSIAKPVLNVANTVRTTFNLSRIHIKKLNQLLAGLIYEKNGEQFYTSTYVLVCAYVIICLVKARRIDDNKKTIQITFPTGCRTRMSYPIPVTYFGNCIGICYTPPMKCEKIRGEDGFLVAAEGIGKAIGELETCGVLSGAEKWVKNSLVDDMCNEKVMVAGTLKLSFYDIDFGWGRPRKNEVISMEKKGAFSLAESRDGDGGVEVGLALPKHEMEHFSCLFIQGLNDLE